MYHGEGSWKPPCGGTGEIHGRGKAVWLFGSALGPMGVMRRKISS